MLYFFYGDNIYLSRKKLREIEGRFHALEGGRESKIRIEAPQETQASIRALIETTSLFRNKRLVIIEASREASSEVQTYVQESASVFSVSEDIIVLWEGGMRISDKDFVSHVKKFAVKTQEFPAPTPGKLRALLDAELRERERALPASTKQILLMKANGDTWRLINELEKTLLETEAGQSIAQYSKKEPNVFLLTDAVGMGRKLEALQLYYQLREEGTTPDQILRALTWHIRSLIIVGDLIRLGRVDTEIIQKTKFHPYVVKKATAQSKKFILHDLSRIYNNLSVLDTETKQHKKNLSIGLERILLAL